MLWLWHDDLLWPHRSPEERLWPVNSLSSRHFDPASAAFMVPIGLEHFFDVFGLTVKRDPEVGGFSTCIPVEEILPDLTVGPESVERVHLVPENNLLKERRG